MVSLEMSVLFGHVQIFGGAAVVVVVVGRFGSSGWLMSYKNFGTMGTVITKIVNYRSRLNMLRINLIVDWPGGYNHFWNQSSRE